MKTKLLTLLVLSVALLSCSTEPVEPIFDIQRDKGIWVPYEIVYADGTRIPGPFLASTIFGIYAESVKINTDGSYVPVSWVDDETNLFKPDEMGSLEFHSESSELFLSEGVWDMTFRVVRNDGNGLWLSPVSGPNQSGNPVYKFKRVRNNDTY